MREARNGCDLVFLSDSGSTVIARIDPWRHVVTSCSTTLINRRNAAAALVAAPLSLHAKAKPFTCTELASFVEGIAKYRDKGVPLSTTERAVAEGGMSGADKKRFTRLVDEVYATPEISPAAWASIAVRTCTIARKRR